MSIGPLAAAAAYILWGIFPLYIRQVSHVSALEIVVHRSVWSLVFVLLLLVVLRRLAWLRDVWQQPRVLGAFALSAVLLSGNWLLYVWAVNAHRVLDASLGYFINPLFNVMLGYVVLHERPRPGQWAAVALAAAGVVWLTVAAGQLPWISLLLAASFGVYGLLRKTAVLGAMEGLALETLLLAPLTVGALAFMLWSGQAAFAQGDHATNLWLLAAGPFTAIPLLLFAVGARRVTMATLGVLQYLGPSIQFVLGVFLFHEPFTTVRGVGFALIWAGLVVYTAESVWRYRRGPTAASAA
jgi:chloramphenicol-sensitive protein RarD